MMNRVETFSASYFRWTWRTCVCIKLLEKQCLLFFSICQVKTIRMYHNFNWFLVSRRFLYSSKTHSGCVLLLLLLLLHSPLPHPRADSTTPYHESTFFSASCWKFGALPSVPVWTYLIWIYFTTQFGTTNTIYDIKFNVLWIVLLVTHGQR